MPHWHRIHKSILQIHEASQKKKKKIEIFFRDATFLKTNRNERKRSIWRAGRKRTEKKERAGLEPMQAGRGVKSKAGLAKSGSLLIYYSFTYKFHHHPNIGFLAFFFFHYYSYTIFIRDNPGQAKATYYT